MIFQEFRYAIRQLSKSPGFAVTAILTLAFGIGAMTAVFSIVEGVLLRPLPFADPSSLVEFGDSIEGSGFGGQPVTGPEIPVYTRETTGVLSSIGAYQQTGFEVSGNGDPLMVNASRMTASAFTTLGVTPVLGRTFTKEEDEGHQQLAVLSYQLWNSRFHHDAGIVGQKIVLDRKPYEVIGVMPREFEFPLVPGQLNRNDLWVPMSFSDSEMIQTGSWGFNMIGRLKPGVSPEMARQDGERVAKEIEKTFPADMSSLHIHAKVTSLAENTVASARPLVNMIFLAVVVVLLLACANLAGLLMVRVIRRKREVAVRLALGASAATILRQNLIEALSLSMGGALLGLGFAVVALRLGISFLPESLPRVGSISLDWEVITFAMGIAALTGVACALLPAYVASRTGVNEALKEGGRTGSAGGSHARLRSVLVVGELAIALVLLVASGLLLRSFDKLRQVDLGFHTDHVLTATYGLPHSQYSTQQAVDTFGTQLFARLRQLPGVEAAGFTTNLPATGQTNYGALVPEGYVSPKGGPIVTSWRSQVAGHYFKAMGISLLRGRDFTEADDATSPLVIIVNHKFAERYWPGQDPIGKRVHFGLPETPLPWMTVVGEIADIRERSVDADAAEQVYQPVSQFKTSLGKFVPKEMLTGTYGALVIRGQMAPEQMVSALRATVHSIDPQLPITQVESMDRVVSEGQASRRFSTVLISSFACAAVLIAVMGIYSVIAFSAALRTQEMAIRLALGSGRASVMRLVLRSAAMLGLAGCGLGVMAAMFASRLIRSMLFQVDPLDPSVIVLATVSIFILTLAASLVPARRAATVDPMQALRNE
jgi:predicted permease